MLTISTPMLCSKITVHLGEKKNKMKLKGIKQELNLLGSTHFIFA